MILEGAEWLLVSGITPVVSCNAADVTRVALKRAGERGLKIALDMNFRAKLWRWEPSLSPRQLSLRVLRELIPFVDLLIGGYEDFASVLDADPTAGCQASRHEMARRVAAQFPNIQLVAMTLREGISAHHNLWGGLLYESAADRFHFAPQQTDRYSITHIVDRLGVGDAFTGSLLFALTPE